MITLAILVGFFVVLTPTVVLSLRGTPGRVRTASDLMGRMQALDLAAFRNLMDVQEEAYLRRSLPPGDYRQVQRARLMAASAYLRRAAANAAVLLRLGEATRDSSDAAIALAGRTLSEHALQLRIQSLMALVQIHVAWAWPGASLELAGVTEGYEQVAGSAMRLGRLQEPARASAVLSVF